MSSVRRSASWSGPPQTADQALATALRDLTDAIIIEHLRPVAERVIGEVRKAAPALRDVGLTDARMAFHADARARNAYKAVEAATTAYQRVRGLHSRLLGYDGAWSPSRAQ